MNTTITFPIAYSGWVTIIGAGFVISTVDRQRVFVTLTNFTTMSDRLGSATNSWLSIGV